MYNIVYYAYWNLTETVLKNYDIFKLCNLTYSTISFFLVKLLPISKNNSNGFKTLYFVDTVGCFLLSRYFEVWTHCPVHRL